MAYSTTIDGTCTFRERTTSNGGGATGRIFRYEGQKENIHESLDTPGIIQRHQAIKENLETP